MSAAPAVHTKILLGKLQISSSTNRAVLSWEADRQDVTPFEATGREWLTTAVDPTLDVDGYMTFNASDANTFEGRTYNALSTADTVGIIKSASTTFAGAVGYVMPDAYTERLDSDNPADGVMTVGATYKSDSGVRRGICVFSGTISATGEQTAIDLGAAGTEGGYAYLFVTTETGTGSGAEIDVESCATQGGSYDSEGTFTFNGIGVDELALSGTVNRWVRINCTDLGGATSWVVHCIVCISGVTY